MSDSDIYHRPKVSVVIPAYNHERFIGPAIDSVLNQTMPDLELVIVDDGSTDNTAKVIQAYDDPRLSYTWQENQDAFNTINRGMSIAQGEYIAILNSDDIYTLDRLEKLLALVENKQAACVISDVIPISDDGEVFQDPEFGWNQWHQKNRNFYFSQKDLYAGFLQGNLMVTTSNLFMTAEAVKSVGEFCSLRYLHDYDFIFRMMLAYPHDVYYMDDSQLLYYRIHDGNTLSEAAITGREQDLEVINKYMLARLPTADRKYAAAGSDRLRALEKELFEVRAQLAQGAGKPPSSSLTMRRIVGAALRRLGLR